MIDIDPKAIKRAKARASKLGFLKKKINFNYIVSDILEENIEDTLKKTIWTSNMI